MITWWAWNTFIIIVFHVSRFSSLESLLDLVYHTAIHNPPGINTFVNIFIIFVTLLTLVNSLLTNTGYCYQDQLIPVYPIHNFREFVTGIFSLVTGDAVIRDSSLLDKYQHVIRMNIYVILIQFLRHIKSITQSLKL